MPGSASTDVGCSGLLPPRSPHAFEHETDRVAGLAHDAAHCQTAIGREAVGPVEEDRPLGQPPLPDLKAAGIRVDLEMVVPRPAVAVTERGHECAVSLEVDVRRQLGAAVAARLDHAPYA